VLFFGHSSTTTTVTGYITVIVFSDIIESNTNNLFVTQTLLLTDS
jgi:hypothetical protein